MTQAEATVCMRDPPLCMYLCLYVCLCVVGTSRLRGDVVKMTLTSESEHMCAVT